MKVKGNPGVTEATLGQDMDHVIDGGMLLQWVPWGDGQTYRELCESYIHFVQSKFNNATVVFDGYEGGLVLKTILIYKYRNHWYISKIYWIDQVSWEEENISSKQ